MNCNEEVKSRGERRVERPEWLGEFKGVLSALLNVRTSLTVPWDGDSVRRVGDLKISCEWFSHVYFHSTILFSIATCDSYNNISIPQFCSISLLRYLIGIATLMFKTDRCSDLFSSLNLRKEKWPLLRYSGPNPQVTCDFSFPHTPFSRESTNLVV